MAIGTWLAAFAAKRGVKFMLKKLLKLDVGVGKKTYLLGGVMALVAVMNMLGWIPEGNALDVESAWKLLGQGGGLIFLRKAIG